MSLDNDNTSRLKWKHLPPDTWFCTIVKSNFFSFSCLTTTASFYSVTNPHVVCLQTMQHHHKLHHGLLQNLYLSFLIWRINQRLYSFCAAEEELECVDTEGPVVCWESLGLPDLDCDEKPGWISNSSLAGELIQPGPQEVWKQPTRKRTRLQCGGFIESRSIVEISQRKDCDGTDRDAACWRDRDAKLLVDRAESSDLGKREWLQETENKARWREMQREKSALLKDRNCIPLVERLS